MMKAGFQVQVLNNTNLPVLNTEVLPDAWVNPIDSRGRNDDYT